MKLTLIRKLLIALIFGGVGALIVAYSGPVERLDGPLYDRVLAARAMIIEGAEPEVAVILLNKASLAHPDLKKLPRTLFAPIWARGAQALIDAKARTIAFDFVFSVFGNGLIPKHDNGFLKILKNNRERIVIGRLATILPARPYIAVLGSKKASQGMLNLIKDVDGVVRRIPPQFGDYPALSFTIANRLGSEVDLTPLRLAPHRPLESLPTYAYDALLTCAETDPEAVKSALAGKAVFIGTGLAEEDRWTSTARYMQPQIASQFEPLCEEVPAFVSDRGSGIPGVYIHAAATDQLLRGDRISTASQTELIAAGFAATFLGALTGMFLSPLLAALVIVLGLAGMFGMETLALIGSLWLPLAVPMLTLGLAALLSYGVRFFTEERRRRRIQQAFGRYLAPTLVDELSADPGALHLGGEERDVTIMFADLSGFTALSDKVSASELMATTNAYLAEIVDIVDASGGYVDKFIGDAVMAIWGAPVAHEDHPKRAVEAALEIVRRVDEMKAQADAAGKPGFAIKIGLNTGMAVVGNVGSDKRYNYTAVGRAVNLAARLEGLPPDYGVSIVMGPDTAGRLKGVIELREVGAADLKGIKGPVPLFTPEGLLQP